VDATTFRAECGLIRNTEYSYTPPLKAEGNQFSLGDYVVESRITGLNQTVKWKGNPLTPPCQFLSFSAAESVLNLSRSRSAVS
jgi:hypothetical protein